MSLELVSLLNPLLEAETIVEVRNFIATLSFLRTKCCIDVQDLEMKMQNLTSADSSICMEEVLGCLSRLALTETQTLDLYWKSRQILNKHYAS